MKQLKGTTTLKAGIYDGAAITSSGASLTTFMPKWWHFIYKIPRRW
ncbi:MAG: hypothetical protein LBV47_04630 [Bacteroidales bacterium]|nr:hypothetical protein [Bacteroidales bacterium]